MLNLFEDTFPANQENVLSVRQRGLEVKDEVFEYVDSEEFSKKYEGVEDPKIAVVAHSMFLKILTSKDSYWTSGIF